MWKFFYISIYIVGHIALKDIYVKLDWSIFEWSAMFHFLKVNYVSFSSLALFYVSYLRLEKRHKIILWLILLISGFASFFFFLLFISSFFRISIIISSASISLLFHALFSVATSTRQKVLFYLITESICCSSTSTQGSDNSLGLKSHIKTYIIHSFFSNNFL